MESNASLPKAYLLALTPIVQHISTTQALWDRALSIGTSHRRRRVNVTSVKAGNILNWRIWIVSLQPIPDTAMLSQVGDEEE